MSTPAEVLVTVRLDGATYAAWRAEAQRRGGEVGQLLAAAAAHARGIRRPAMEPEPEARTGRNLTQRERLGILAQPNASSSELARLYGVTGQTIRNVRKAGR